jgi:outer membrane protein assembly factor BamB
MMSFSEKQNRVVRSLLLVSAIALIAGCEKELVLEGERFDIRADLSASIPVEGEAAPVDSSQGFANQSLPISLPGVTAVSEWTHRAGNARHLSPHATLSANPKLAWSVDIGSGNSRKFRITAAPVVAQGRIFTLDAAGNIAATSTAGAKLWSVNLQPQSSRSAQSGGGLAFGDGRLYVTSAYAELLSIDPASGAVIWRQNLGAPAAGAPTVDNGVVYATARDGSAWAVRASDGRVEWQFGGTPSPSGVIGSAAPAVADNTVLFAFGSNEIVSVLKSDGVPQWRISVSGRRPGRAYAGISDITGDPVVAGNVTFIGNQSGYSTAIDTETGRKLWSTNEAAYGPMLPVGGSVFLISDEAQLVRLNAQTGQKIWAVELPYFTKTKDKRRAQITPHFGPVLAGGRVVIASGDGTLRMFNPTDGTLVGTTQLPGGAASAPALVGGSLYVVSEKGQLHAFR